MMMPANYSVIAENEMTYVVGGGLFDVLPDVMTSANWKTFNTNLLMLVGNGFVGDVVKSTLGVMFGGHWGEAGNTMFVPVTTPAEDPESQPTVTAGGITKWYANTEMSVLNKVMGTIGGLAAIYALGAGTVKASLPTSFKG